MSVHGLDPRFLYSDCFNKGIGIDVDEFLKGVSGSDKMTGKGVY